MLQVQQQPAKSDWVQIILGSSNPGCPREVFTFRSGEGGGGGL